MSFASFLQFSAVVIVSYLGLLAGFVLASVTREELPTAKKYLPFLQSLIILAAAAVAMEYFSVGIFVKVVVYLLLLLLLAIRIKTRPYYAVFGVLAFFVSASQNALLVLSSLVFLFGLLSGSIYFERNVKRKADFTGKAAEMLVNNSFYPVVAVVLYAVSAYV